jgi:uncharacterized protein
VDPLHTGAAVGSGVIVGFTLGLVGGGGSILAVPLLLYVVGMPDPHLAIGTSAVAVAVNAFANLVPHAREQHVRWHRALVFAAAGLAGAFAGSSIGKAVDGRRLLILFALLMLFVAAMMLRGRKADTGSVSAGLPVNLWRLGPIGLGVGSLSGFYGDRWRVPRGARSNPRDWYDDDRGDWVCASRGRRFRHHDGAQLCCLRTR